MSTACERDISKWVYLSLLSADQVAEICQVMAKAEWKNVEYWQEI